MCILNILLIFDKTYRDGNGWISKVTTIGKVASLYNYIIFKMRGRLWRAIKTTLPRPNKCRNKNLRLAKPWPLAFLQHSQNCTSSAIVRRKKGVMDCPPTTPIGEQ